MSKKGKRLREFEKKNKTFNIREAKPKESVPAQTEPKKTKKKTVLHMRRLVASTVILIFVVSIGVSAVKLIQLKNEKDKLLDRQAELMLLKEDLTAELDHVDSPEYIEQQARKNLRLIKENEILFILPEKPNKDDSKDGQAQN